MPKQNSVRERQAAHFPAFDMGAPNQNAVHENNSLAPFHALVKRLSEAYGPPGSEETVRDLVRAEIKEYVDQVRVDALGNLIAQRKGSGSARKKVMLSTHLDEVGLIVTFVDARGFARVGMLGAVKPLTLLGARAQFENGTVGVIGREERNAARSEIETEALFIDTSAAGTPGVQVGDTACLAREFIYSGDFLIGKALNSRVGCAVLIHVLRQLKKSPHDLFFVFTVQHQVGARGAGTAAFAIQPDVAFVVDATAAQDTPGAVGDGVALGKGPTIKFQDEGALTSGSARQYLIRAARDAHAPYQLDVAPRVNSDGMYVQSSRLGVPTAVLGLPTRYLNTPSEMQHLTDAQDAIQLVQMLLSKPF